MLAQQNKERKMRVVLLHKVICEKRPPTPVENGSRWYGVDRHAAGCFLVPPVEAGSQGHGGHVLIRFVDGRRLGLQPLPPRFVHDDSIGIHGEGFALSKRQSSSRRRRSERKNHSLCDLHLLRKDGRDCCCVL